MIGRRQTGLFAKTRPLENSHLELDALRVVTVDKPGVLHEGSERNTASDGGLEAGIVDQVDGTRLRHEVDGGNEDDEEGGAEDLDKIEVEGVPYLIDLVRTHAQELNPDTHHYRDEQEGKNMVDKVPVPKFDILELHRTRETGHFFYLGGPREKGREGGREKLEERKGRESGREKRGRVRWDYKGEAKIVGIE